MRERARIILCVHVRACVFKSDLESDSAEFGADRLAGYSELVPAESALIPSLFSPRRRAAPARVTDSDSDLKLLGSAIAYHTTRPLRKAYVAAGPAGLSSSRYCIVSNDTGHVLESMLAQAQWLNSPPGFSWRPAPKRWG